MKNSSSTGIWALARRACSVATDRVAALSLDRQTIEVAARRHVLLLCSVVYLILASYMTFPFIISPSSTMTAPIGGDVGNSVVLYEAIKREGLNPFVTNRVYSIAAPDGLAWNRGVARVSFFSVVILWVGTVLSNAVTIHSLLTLLGYFLTGLVTCLFVYKVTRSALVGFLAGYMASFATHIVGISRADPIYMYTWLFILPIWCFWNLGVKGLSRSRVLLAALSVVPAIFWTPYYMLHVILVGVSCLLVITFILREKYGLRYMLGIAAGIGSLWVLLLIAYYVIGMSGGADSVPVRTLQEAYQQSAYPLMYVLPGCFSSWGQGLYHFLVQHVPRAQYTSLYLGMSCLILSAISVYGLLRMQLSQKLRLAIMLGLAICLTTFTFSLAPTVSVFGVHIPTPNKLVVTFVPALRAGQRLVMPLTIGVAILASIGAYILVKGLPTRVRSLLLVLILLVVALDLSSTLPENPTHMSTYPALATLSRMPIALTAQYNYSSLVSNPGQDICFPQLQHKMPIVNDCAINRNPYDFNRPTPTLSRVVDAPICDQPGLLNQLGVRYVILTPINNSIRKCLTRTDVPVIIHDSTYSVYDLRK